MTPAYCMAANPRGSRARWAGYCSLEQNHSGSHKAHRGHDLNAEYATWARNEMTERSTSMPTASKEQQVNAIQAWCPACAGSGSVMSLSGPDDCPNAEAHSLLAQLAGL